jgi:hypothetical protein
MLDRLPPGRYVIELVKPDIRGQGWQLEVAEMTMVRVMTLPAGTAKE